MGSKKSSSSSSSTTNQTDNSALAGDNSLALAAGSSLWQYSDNDTTYVGTDPGALQMVQLGQQLAGAVAESNSDAVKFMTAAGADMVNKMGESVTKLYGQAGSNNAESWGATVSAAERLFESTAATLKSSWADTMGASAALAQGVVTAAQPVAKDEQKTMQVAMWAAAAVAAVVLVANLKK